MAGKDTGLGGPPHGAAYRTFRDRNGLVSSSWFPSGSRNVAVTEPQGIFSGSRVNRTPFCLKSRYAARQSATSK